MSTPTCLHQCAQATPTIKSDQSLNYSLAKASHPNTLKHFKLVNSHCDHSVVRL
jgi:hypothetical protein